jgi:CHAT domain-containing protein
VPPDRARMLAVAMPTTPGQIDLHGVVKEVSRITGLIQNNFVVQSLADPTTEEVLGQLEHHDIVYFACYGSSNIFDTSDSCLLFRRLQPSKAELVSDPLTVRQVAYLRLVVARIAFLSACSTAEAKGAATCLRGHSPRQWISGGRVRPGNWLAVIVRRPDLCDNRRGFLSQTRCSSVDHVALET